MKTLKQTLFIIVLALCINYANAQCPIPVWAYSSGATAQFNSGFYDSTNVLSTYYWDFGDGDTSNSLNATHIYSQSGTYNYCFHYTGLPCRGDTCNTLTVDICNFNPQINYSGSYPDYTFSATNVPPNATSYSWVIYDSVQNVIFTSSLQSPQFTLPAYSTNYSASVQITLANGCSDNGQTTFYISNPCGVYFYHVQDTTQINFYAFTYDSLNASQYSYAWDFGDGNIGTGQNPRHDYGGYGTWNVCVMVNGQVCTSSTCQNISIAAPPPPTYYIFGTISKGGARACASTIYLISDSSGFLSLINTYVTTMTVDSGGVHCNGNYSFYNLQPGTYYIKAALDSADIDYASYLPTYYGDVLNWGNATAVNLNSSQSNININLTAGVNPGGPGFIGGWVTQGAGLTANGSNIGRGAGDPLSNVQINLITDNDVPVASTTTNVDGRYTFANLALGTYKVYAEVINKVPYPLTVTLNANNPSEDNVNVSVNSNTAVTGIDDLQDIQIGGVFPNPVTDQTAISLSLKQNLKLQMSLTDIEGRILQNKVLNLTSGMNQLKLDLSNQSSGVYFLSLISNVGNRNVRLVKTR